MTCLPQHPNFDGTGDGSGQTSIIKLTSPRMLLPFAAGLVTQEQSRAGVQTGALAAACHIPLLTHWCVYSTRHLLTFQSSLHLDSLKTTMIKITTLAIWITSNTRGEMPSIEFNMRSCVGSEGVCSPQTADCYYSMISRYMHSWKSSVSTRWKSQLSRQILSTPTAPSCQSRSPYIWTKPRRLQCKAVMYSWASFTSTPFYKASKINPFLWKMHKTQSSFHQKLKYVKKVMALKKPLKNSEVVWGLCVSTHTHHVNRDVQRGPGIPPTPLLPQWS